VDALAGILGKGRKRSSELEVVVSSHFVRYVLVPWSENLVRDAERLAFARLAFRDVYGNLVDHWEICLDDQPAGHPALACAIDRELLAAIRDVAIASGVRLQAVTPALSDCFNRHRRALKSREFCLANVEPGRVTFGFRVRAGWRAVRSRRMEGPAPGIVADAAQAGGVGFGRAGRRRVVPVCASRTRPRERARSRLESGVPARGRFRAGAGDGARADLDRKLVMALQEIQLDFMHPAGRASRYGPLLLVVGVVAAACRAVLPARGWPRARCARSASRGIARHGQSDAALRSPKKNPTRLRCAARYRRRNAVLQQLNVPWNELFAAVESAEGADVALLAVQPDPRSHNVVIGGVARNLPAVFAYMDRLEHTKRLARRRVVES
jgi:hypothetical protein